MPVTHLGRLTVDHERKEGMDLERSDQFKILHLVQNLATAGLTTRIMLVTSRALRLYANML
jgi:hypothetical protein